MSLIELKQRIKELPISTVIGNYIHLKARTPGTYLAICPFHADKRPSLHVNDGKGLFRCFPCDIGGDAITFVEKFAHLSFSEALEDIGRKIGLPVDDYLSQTAKDPKYEMALKLVKERMLSYKKEAEESPLFKQFIQERQLTPEVVAQFSLGFSPLGPKASHWIELLSPEELEVALELGLIRENTRTGKLHDMFLGRVVFPIHDTFKQVVGFSSRIVGPQSYGPKYQNSKSSFLFNKKNLLYGLPFAKQKIREQDQVIIVEGHMDLITLHKRGITQSVAVMGVGLSERSIELLKAMTSHFVLALDNDEAGFKAMASIHENCVKQGIIPKYLDLSPHKDPDDFLKKESLEEFYGRLKEAPLFLTLLLEKALPTPLPEASEEKLLILKEFYKILAPLEGSLLALELLSEYAGRLQLQISMETIQGDYLRQQGLQQHPKVRPLKLKVKSRPPLSKEGALGEEKRPLLDKIHKSMLHDVLSFPSYLQSQKLIEILENVLPSEVQPLIRVARDLYYEVDDHSFVPSLLDYLSSEQVEAEIRQVVGGILYHHCSQERTSAQLNKLVQDFTLRWQMLKGRMKKSEKVTLLTQQRDYSASLDLLGEIHQIDRKQ